MSLFNYQCEENKRIIDEVSPNYPQLTTYEKEWIFFHKYHYSPSLPVELECQEIIVNPTGTVQNAIPYSYKSAILKGSTKYCDIDTGEILDTFVQTKNLKLVSIKKPVLKTTGKNLFDGEWEQGAIDQITGELFTSSSYRCKNKIPVVPLSQIVSSANLNLLFYDENDLFVGYKYQGQGMTMQVPAGAVYLRFYRGVKLDDLQVEENIIPTTYEPYKSNILTVNESVELCGIGDVKDELNLLTGELVQKITEETLSTNAWALDPSNPSSTNMGFYINHSNSKVNGTILSAQYPTLTAEQWKNKSVCGIYKGSASIGFVIARSSLTEQTLTGFKKWLTKNPITIKYELANPVIKTVALTKLNKPYEGTNHYHVSANIPCEAILEVPVVSTGEQTLQEINNY